MEKSHNYALDLEWTGAAVDGTFTYEGYSREHTIRIVGKPDIITTADPAFRGDPTKHNPEDLLLAALAGCHMLTYLALCARKRILVKSYRDRATGTMLLSADGGGRFTEVTLHPEVVVAEESMVENARSLHKPAHKYCFIANSVNFPVLHEPVVLLPGY
jgi:organic hydroperoxide reductase OsmC/OhrA